MPYDPRRTVSCLTRELRDSGFVIKAAPVFVSTSPGELDHGNVDVIDREAYKKEASNQKDSWGWLSNRDDLGSARPGPTPADGNVPDVFPFFQPRSALQTPFKPSYEPSHHRWELVRPRYACNHPFFIHSVQTETQLFDGCDADPCSRRVRASGRPIGHQGTYPNLLRCDSGCRLQR